MTAITDKLPITSLQIC